MTREEAIHHLEEMKKGIFLWDMSELIDFCISALSIPKSTDLISREAVIDLLNQFGYYDKEMERDLSAIPSAVPEREKGEWVYSERFSTIYPMYVCSKCSGLNRSCYDNFCSNCGADMRGE